MNIVKWSSQGMLRLTQEAMNELFQPTINNIVKHIGEEKLTYFPLYPVRLRMLDLFTPKPLPQCTFQMYTGLMFMGIEV